MINISNIIYYLIFIDPQCLHFDFRLFQFKHKMFIIMCVCVSVIESVTVCVCVIECVTVCVCV